jgi:hypothetical protein
MRSPPFFLLLGSLVLSGTTPSIGAPLCKPALVVKEYQFAEPRPSQRVWAARIAVDASHCATPSGPFNVDFVRLKENAPDLRFTQQFTWKPGQVEASTDFALDEYVLDFSIGDIAACPCRE